VPFQHIVSLLDFGFLLLNSPQPGNVKSMHMSSRSAKCVGQQWAQSNNVPLDRFATTKASTASVLCLSHCSLRDEHSRDIYLLFGGSAQPHAG